LPLDVLLMVAMALDMLSLLRLCAVSKPFHAFIHGHLAACRDALVAHYVPEPHLFLSCMRDFYVIIGGMAALSFTVHDSSLRPPWLDVYVTTRHWDLFEADLGKFLKLEQVYHNDRRAYGVNTPYYMYRTALGRLLRVFVSDSLSPLHALIRSAPTTALFNYVGPDSFGVAYPWMTLRRRGLAPGWRRGRGYLDHWQRWHLTVLLSKGFVFRKHAASFDDVRLPIPFADVDRWPMDENTLAPICLRDQFLCTSQGRVMGDRGTIIVLFDTYPDAHKDLRRKHQLPYGFTTAWRFPGAVFDCGGDCLHEDDILPLNVNLADAILGTLPVLLASRRSPVPGE
ncbi:hypothetical protein LXA43DRAFT_906401, partial [Ganoderma leucocontextum]